MTQPVTGQVGLAPGDEVARRLGLRARETYYGRRGPARLDLGAAGSARAGPDWQVGTLVPPGQRSPELTGQG